MFVASDHCVNHLWDEDDIPFDESVDRPLVSLEQTSELTQTDLRGRRPLNS